MLLLGADRAVEAISVVPVVVLAAVVVGVIVGVVVEVVVGVVVDAFGLFKTRGV